MGINLGTLKGYFDKYNNGDDIIHLVDYELDEVFWTGKIKDVYGVKHIDRHAIGMASRHFVPISGKYEDGVFLYVRRMYI